MKYLLQWPRLTKEAAFIASCCLEMVLVLSVAMPSCVVVFVMKLTQSVSIENPKKTQRRPSTEKWCGTPVWVEKGGSQRWNIDVEHGT